MKYCTKCFYPTTKPDLYFKDGVCGACIAFEKRKDIDWKAREKEFVNITSTLRGTPGYHCIVPVSGGKDSTCQVLKCLEYGLNPLAINARTDDLTPIGRRNLDNIANLGVDLIEVHCNEKVRRRISKYGLETVGDISWAEHGTIFTVPFREAFNRGIQYIFWGENPQNEYGGPEKDQGTKELTTAWLQEFGGLNGLRVADLVDAKVATKQELLSYVVYPQATGIRSLFMGYYFPWSGLDNALLAKKHGFEWNLTPVDGSGCEYENLDNYQTGIHDLFKRFKFGFGRATDIVNNNIRRGICSRELGREHIFTWESKCSGAYLGKSYKDILDNIEVTWSQFSEICFKFTNKELFELTNDPINPKAKFTKDLLNA